MGLPAIRFHALSTERTRGTLKERHQQFSNAMILTQAMIRGFLSAVRTHKLAGVVELGEIDRGQMPCQQGKVMSFETSLCWLAATSYGILSIARFDNMTYCPF